MIDHMGIVVADLARSRAFYAAAFAPLAFAPVMEWEGNVGFGPPGRPQFWISQGRPSSPLHLAFEAKTREAVRAFHAAALKAGAKDNGPPGLRPHYHSTYYAAFAIDPDGHNIEAVCHSPEG